MEAPPPPPTSVAAATTSLLSPSAHHHPPYPSSLDSSPRSTDDHPPTTFPTIPPPSYSSSAAAAAKLRLMCSYGGHIVPRPHDKSLCYVGGETRIVVVDRHSTLYDLLSRLSKLLLSGKPFTLKYQLPSEDLDSLITVSNEEDLENMLDEYDRLTAASSKPSRLRLFLFPPKPDTAPSSIASILDGSSAKSSDDWFFNALNGTRTGIGLPRGFSDPASVNSLLGLEENVENSGNSDHNSKEEGGRKSGKLGISNNNSNQDVHSMPDSPMIETTSSFGSTSSSLANLAPAERGGGDRVRVFDQRIEGIQEQFSQLGVGAGLQLKQDEGYLLMPSQVLNTGTAAVVTGVPVAADPAGAEYLNRVVSDDERSDHGVPVGYQKSSAAEYPNRAVSDDERSDQGVPVGYRKPTAAEYLNRVASDDEMSDHGVPVGHLKQNPPAIVSSQQMPIGSEFPSSAPVPSDPSLPRTLSRQKTMTHQDSGGQVPPLGSTVAPNLVDSKVVNVPEPGSVMVQMRQKSDSGYALPSQYDLQQQQPQQFIANPHYVHHTPAGPVPIPAYYPFYASQHPQLPHHQGQYPVYYIPAGHPQAYGLPMQQPGFTDAPNAVHTGGAQAPSNPAIISTPEVYNPTGNLTTQKTEVAAGVYRVAAGAPSAIVQVASGQHVPQQQQQYVQFPQRQYVQMPQHMTHSSQSIAHASGAAGSYAYEFADPGQARLYYPQSMPLQLAPQHQTISTAHAAVSPDSSAQLPADNVKQQARGGQPQV